MNLESLEFNGIGDMLSTTQSPPNDRRHPLHLLKWELLYTVSGATQITNKEYES